MIMVRMTKLEKLVQSRNKVVTIQDLAVIWGVCERRKLLELIKYYVRKGRLKTLKNGIYAVSDEYDKFELAQKFVPVSYISFYSALAFHGIIFQFYEEIHSVSLATRHAEINNQLFFYHKVKSDIFFNSLGIEAKEHYTIASPERSVCDSLYLKPNLAFDNLSKLNHQKLIEISRYYGNKSLEGQIQKIVKNKNA